jgi:hypothetical protein
MQIQGLAMTINKHKLVTDPAQMNLFEQLSQARDERVQQLPGSRCISAQYLAAVKQALKQAHKSRETIADEMSFISGRTVTVSMINNWAADSHPHELSAEMEYYLCLVCGCDAPIRLKNDKLGLYTLPGPDALRAEIQKLDEEEKRVAAEKRKHKLLLQSLEAPATSLRTDK